MSEFIIPIQIREEQDLYAEFDPLGLSFSSDLNDYLSDYMEDRRLGEKVIIEIRSSAQPDMERLRKAFLLSIDKLSQRNKREIIRHKVNSMRLLLTGIIFILIGILSAIRTKEVIAAIISTIGSFSVWEASAVWIETLPALRKRERILNMLADTEFRYVGSGTE